MTTTVLVVDNDAAITNEVSALLNERGYKTLSANSTEKAFGILTSTHIDVVLTDVLLPGAPGTHLRHLIKQSSMLHNVRVIYMTAFAPTSDTNNAPLIRKPFSGDELAKFVQHALDAPAPSYRDELSI